MGFFDTVAKSVARNVNNVSIVRTSPAQQHNLYPPAPVYPVRQYSPEPVYQQPVRQYSPEPTYTRQNTSSSGSRGSQQPAKQQESVISRAIAQVDQSKKAKAAPAAEIRNPELPVSSPRAAVSDQLSRASASAKQLALSPRAVMPSASEKGSKRALERAPQGGMQQPGILAKKAQTQDPQPNTNGGLGTMMPDAPTPTAVENPVPTTPGSQYMGSGYSPQLENRAFLFQRLQQIDPQAAAVDLSGLSDQQLEGYVNAILRENATDPTRQTIWGTPGFLPPDGESVYQGLDPNNRFDAAAGLPAAHDVMATQLPFGTPGAVAPPGQMSQSSLLVDPARPGYVPPAPVDPNDGTSFTDLVGAGASAGGAFLDGIGEAVTGWPIIGGPVSDLLGVEDPVQQPPMNPMDPFGSAPYESATDPRLAGGAFPQYPSTYPQMPAVAPMGWDPATGLPTRGGSAQPQPQAGAPGFAGDPQQLGADFQQMVENTVSDPNSGLALGEPGSFANQVDEFQRANPDYFIGHYGSGGGYEEAAVGGGDGGSGGGYGYGGYGGGGYGYGGGYGGYGGYSGGGYGGGYGSGGGDDSDAAVGPMGGWASRYNAEGAGAILGNPSAIARDTLLDLGVENQQLADLLSDRLTDIVADILPIIKAYAKVGDKPNTAGIINFFHEVALRLLINDAQVQNIPQMLRDWYQTGGKDISADTLKELLEKNGVESDDDTAPTEDEN